VVARGRELLTWARATPAIDGVDGVAIAYEEGMDR
jgi:hypothetical protein